MTGLKTLERSLLALGVVLMAVWAGAAVYRTAASGRALAEFDEAQAAAAGEDRKPTLEYGGEKSVDFSLWAEKRVRAYSKSLAAMSKPPVAVVRIEKVDLRVPVFEGTDELTLNRGVGWIAGTARPGEDGNIGIAGHRDAFFRKLKDVSPGDTVELTTIRETAVYGVDRIQIVQPDDVTVLRQSAVPSLTLVTCYPFYFAGHAPKRYILHGSLKERAANRK